MTEYKWEAVPVSYMASKVKDRESEGYKLVDWKPYSGFYVAHDGSTVCDPYIAVVFEKPIINHGFLMEMDNGKEHVSFVCTCRTYSRDFKRGTWKDIIRSLNNHLRRVGAKPVSKQFEELIIKYTAPLPETGLRAWLRKTWRARTNGTGPGA